jgi:hypothetical protein
VSLAFVVVLGHAVAAVVLSWLYFRRYRMTRPPIGVVTLGDVGITLVGIVLVPYLYLALPPWLVGALLMLAMASILYALWEPVARAAWGTWLAVVVLIGADLGAWLWLGPASRLAFVVNNVVLSLAVVGVANLWAQSGMKARDAALLGGALAIYDFVSTVLLALMADLLRRLADLPFAPLMAWPVGEDGTWLGIGLGDVLLSATFPLVMRKAFGRSAGLIALALALGAVGAMLALFAAGMIRATLPAMVALGPLMALQYVAWVRRRGTERTTWHYLQADPLSITPGR